MPASKSTPFSSSFLLLLLLLLKELNLLLRLAKNPPTPPPPFPAPSSPCPSTPPSPGAAFGTNMVLFLLAKNCCLFLLLLPAVSTRSFCVLSFIMTPAVPLLIRSFSRASFCASCFSRSSASICSLNFFDCASRLTMPPPTKESSSLASNSKLSALVDLASFSIFSSSAFLFFSSFLFAFFSFLVSSPSGVSSASAASWAAFASASSLFLFFSFFLRFFSRFLSSSKASGSKNLLSSCFFLLTNLSLWSDFSPKVVLAIILFRVLPFPPRPLLRFSSFVCAILFLLLSSNSFCSCSLASFAFFLSSSMTSFIAFFLPEETIL
mmetsp:Transcript_12799/g.23412  ORF Transcript_12799/g.23412 Transcript_12799/m.23412 type:complete len:322 (-) Transcript_12799:1148-2113(-)